MIWGLRPVVMRKVKCLPTAKLSNFILSLVSERSTETEQINDDDLKAKKNWTFYSFNDVLFSSLPFSIRVFLSIYSDRSFSFHFTLFLTLTISLYLFLTLIITTRYLFRLWWHSRPTFFSPNFLFPTGNLLHTFSCLPVPWAEKFGLGLFYPFQFSWTVNTVSSTPVNKKQNGREI